MELVPDDIVPVAVMLLQNTLVVVSEPVPLFIAPSAEMVVQDIGPPEIDEVPAANPPEATTAPDELIDEHTSAPVVMELVPLRIEPVETNDVHDNDPVVIAFVPLVNVPVDVIAAQDRAPVVMALVPLVMVPVDVIAAQARAPVVMAFVPLPNVPVAVIAPESIPNVPVFIDRLATLPHDRALVPHEIEPEAVIVEQVKLPVVIGLVPLVNNPSGRMSVQYISPHCIDPVPTFNPSISSRGPMNPLILTESHIISPVDKEFVPFFISPVEVSDVQDNEPVVIGLVPLSIPEVTIELVQVNDEQVNAPVVIA